MEVAYLKIIEQVLEAYRKHDYAEAQRLITDVLTRPGWTAASF